MDTSQVLSLALAGIAITLGGIAWTLLLQGRAWRKGKNTRKIGNEALVAGCLMAILTLLLFFYSLYKLIVSSV